MENITNILDKYTPVGIQKALWFFKLDSFDLLLAIMYIVFVYLFIKSTKNIKKLLKLYLYRNRKDSFYRYLFFRVEKIAKPLITPEKSSSTTSTATA